MNSFLSSRSKEAVFERTRGRAVEFYFNGARPVRTDSTGRFRKIPFCVLVPILEHDFGWDSTRIHELYESYELAVQAWETIRLNWLTFHNGSIHDLPLFATRTTGGELRPINTRSTDVRIADHLRDGALAFHQATAFSVQLALIADVRTIWALLFLFRKAPSS